MSRESVVDNQILPTFELVLQQILIHVLVDAEKGHTEKRLIYKEDHVPLNATWQKKFYTKLKNFSITFIVLVNF